MCGCGVGWGLFIEHGCVTGGHLPENLHWRTLNVKQCVCADSSQQVILERHASLTVSEPCGHPLSGILYPAHTLLETVHGPFDG